METIADSAWKSKQDTENSKVRIIAVTSGKGGVGKTNIAANLAMVLQKCRRNVLLIDLDLGLANVDILLGLHPKYTLQDVIEGRKSVNEVIVHGPGGIKIVPASSGIEGLTHLNDMQKEQLFKGFNRLDEEIDIAIVDTGAGISSDVLNFVLASNEILVVTTPEPTAITDAYAMIKVLSRKKNNLTIKLMVNLSSSREEAELTIKKITSVTRRFLDVNIEYIGYLLQDPNVLISSRRQKAFVLEYPNTMASNCLVKIVTSVLKENGKVPCLGVEAYFRRIAGVTSEKA
ncbi:MAG: MinD/ParA family protein [Candidatus Brocadiaceae bacterium]|nr:MinD/ParA family protein [Candidatus Brocadiaceae bacterium]